ncbi:MAG TPA: polynucleotide adenylyltransferase PcnB [Pseudomonadales bacterium]|jgi:poly(A) polymerase|nr:polynucleotide adenylyltransferase PcnB [Pseudomonadales bacterium]
MLDWIKRRISSAQTSKAPRKTGKKGLKSSIATVITPQQHGIPEQKINSHALQVIRRLQEAGYDAHIVGGGVRDLLLGLRPKDFDVATSATPEQVRQVFRHSRIIGRRFRIVHVLFGREVIEVTTFRGHHSNASNGKEAIAHDSGLLLRDNVYGSIEEDAIRRDFTVNALYYGTDHCIRDFCNGIRDIEKRRIHIIGDPDTRYREDPVRMLRAVRLAAKLDFSIEKNTAAPIAQLAPLLRDISNARLFDEMSKLLLAGYAVKTFELMVQYRLFHVLFPGPARYFEAENYTDRLIRQALTNTDARIRGDLRVTPAFLYAALLWPVLQQEQQREQHNGLHPHQALQKIIPKVIGEQTRLIGIPRRFTLPMQEIWELQWQLTRRQGGRADKLLEHPRFRAAYDFLLLREQVGEELNGLGSWWTQYQTASPEEREQLRQNLQRDSSAPRNPRRRRNSRKTTTH